jgi:hypothetical protein
MHIHESYPKRETLNYSETSMIRILTYSATPSTERHIQKLHI